MAERERVLTEATPARDAEQAVRKAPPARPLTELRRVVGPPLWSDRFTTAECVTLLAALDADRATAPRAPGGPARQRAGLSMWSSGLAVAGR